MKKKKIAYAKKYENISGIGEHTDELFQPSRHTTDIPVKDKQWFAGVFIEGERRTMEYLLDIPGKKR